MVRAMPHAQRFSCALVTGASAGLGEEFAFQLAPRVDVLVLVARRAERLRVLTQALNEVFPGLRVEVVTADLTAEGGCQRVADSLSELGLVPDLLVNNAGMGDYGEFVTAEWSKLEAMLRLNVEALTRLTHAVLPGMIARGGGAVVNVSSLACLLPIPDFAVYAATKAYVSSFSEALRIELKEHGIPVLAVCPGPVRTEFGEVARRDPERDPAIGAFYVSKERVVEDALLALDRNRARVYPGLKIAVAAAVIAALPLCAIRLVMGRRPRR